MRQETLACLGFSLFKEITPIQFKKLLAIFQTAPRAYWAKESALTKLLGQHLARLLIGYREKTDLKHIWRNLIQAETGYVAYVDQNYPYLLKQIVDPPIGLFYRGNYHNYEWSKDRFLAMVGTRRPSQYGRTIAEQWGQTIARENIVLVSGLALGIDTVVHEASLKAKGRTIAVLGCGIDCIYPLDNRSLYWQIVKNNGLIISEFPFQQKVDKEKFVARNRIISGLSKAVLIIEGTAKSGTLITARQALEQGREVLVLPGEINRANSEAPLLLLKQGAIPVTEVKDVLMAV